MMISIPGIDIRKGRNSPIAVAIYDRNTEAFDKLIRHPDVNITIDDISFSTNNVFNFHMLSLMNQYSLNIFSMHHKTQHLTNELLREFFIEYIIDYGGRMIEQTLLDYIKEINRYRISQKHGWIKWSIYSCFCRLFVQH